AHSGNDAPYSLRTIYDTRTFALKHSAIVRTAAKWLRRYLIAYNCNPVIEIPKILWVTLDGCDDGFINVRASLEASDILRVQIRSKLSPSCDVLSINLPIVRLIRFANLPPLFQHNLKIDGFPYSTLCYDAP